MKLAYSSAPLLLLTNATCSLTSLRTIRPHGEGYSGTCPWFSRKRFLRDFANCGGSDSLSTEPVRLPRFAINSIALGIPETSGRTGVDLSGSLGKIHELYTQREEELQALRVEVTLIVAVSTPHESGPYDGSLNWQGRLTRNSTPGLFVPDSGFCLLGVDLPLQSADVDATLLHLFSHLIDAFPQPRNVVFLLLDHLGKLVVALVRVHFHGQVQGFAGRDGHAQLEVAADDSLGFSCLFHGGAMVRLCNLEVGVRLFESRRNSSEGVL
ncbi:hypothetical protein B0J12DRAFT_86481 [Macrophomina phaseolina]|uniref:Uncharacterized protein n=1 Tax=Macrophomina phaseolina TaxID=35725 RepID=A0ABQ8GA98_9PEZI|nr:hypothetical protein B0J12DRAFT_86481 [Macrophomina phaseolina]